MKELEFDKQNPTIFQIICNLNTQEAQRNGGITFDEFIFQINKQIGDKTSREGIRRIFDLFKDDPNTEVISLSALKKISQELGENLSDEELEDMLKRCSKNGKSELTFEEFYYIMAEKKFE